MRIAISGASGLVGSHLTRALDDAGHEVLRLVRCTPGRNEIEWRPERGLVDPEAAEALDAVVHLAGESLASGRWNRARKRRFWDSRVGATERLALDLSRLQEPPGAFLSASAVGLYGDRGSELLDETSAPGSGFLSDLCVAWEAAAAAHAAASRTVLLRFGVILDGRAGALPRMVLPLDAFVGILGTGRQHFPWIARPDVVRAILFLLERPSLSGPFNLVAPADDTNETFCRALGRALRRPVLKAPPAILRLATGEMADEMLLASQRARPRALESAGFEFRYPDAESALSEVLRER